MPAPTQYSEAIFADYLYGVIGEAATMLGWTAGSFQVQEAVADTLLDLNLSSIALAVTPFQLRGLRTLGRRAIWRAVVHATAWKFDFSDADARFSRSQIHAQALENLALAETDCLSWSPTYAASLVGVNRTADPYIVIPDSARIP